MNHKIIISLLLLISLVFIASIPEFKEIEKPDTVKKKIIAKAKSTKNIQSDFIQEKHLGMFEEVLISKGEFFFKNPNLIRWQYNEPISYTIVMNGKKILIKDGKKLKEYDINSNPIFKEINKLLIGSLSGEILNSKDFKISFYESKYKYMARLMPQNTAMTDVLNSIEIYFNKIDYGVTGIKLNESGSDFTHIKFNQRIINGTIPKNTFKLK